jgi:hypothetical protein
MCDHPVHQNIPGLKYALKLADEDLYPNIHTICKLLIVFPVMYVCCKRSFSALRRHKTRVRSTMTGEYLCAINFYISVFVYKAGINVKDESSKQKFAM